MAKGHCLCGAVHYEFEGAPMDTAHCYCESCRRATSSPVTTFLTVKRDALTFSGDAPGVYRSSPGVERLYCLTCGSPMGYRESSRPGEFDLYAASLDDPSQVKPDHHSFHGEKLPWIELADDLPRHEKESSS